MKQLIVTLMILSLFGCHNRSKNSVSSDSNQQEIPKFDFLKEFHNFGSLQAGEIVAYSFQFTNVGEGDLLIHKIDTGCGCIEVNYTRNKIITGQSEFIEVIFNSSGEMGNIYKEIEIYTESPKTTTKLSIAATVKNEIINLYSKN